jgi:4-hydroxy-tetrahydrodipicolinate synthase
VTRRIYELCRAGTYAEAMEWQYRILELFDAMLNTFEFPDGFRAAAALRGFEFGHGRQPLSAAQEREKAALAEVLQCILADFGLVEAPAGGCAPRTRELAKDNVAQVVFEVLNVLNERGMI